MDKEFKTAVDSLDAQRRGPVEAAKRELAGVRAALVQLEKECAAKAAKVRPVAVEVQAQVGIAQARGLFPPINVTIHLRHALGDGYLPGLLEGAATTCKLKIEQIDRLTPDDVYQGTHRSLANAAVNARANLGALDKLEAALREDCKVMLDVIRQAAPPVAAVVQRDPPAPVQTDTRFELYGRQMGGPLTPPFSKER